MKACVYRAPGAPLEIAEVPDPVARAGELVVRVKACGICGSDPHAAGRTFRMPLGTIMGHEFAGVVEALGDGVEGFAPITAMGKELDLRFSLGLERAEVESAIAMLAAGRVATAPMITHTMGLDDLPRAFAALARPANQSKGMVEV